jgi:hypothetical protein
MLPRHKIAVAVVSVAFLTACSPQISIVDIDATTKGYHITCDSTPPVSSYQDCTKRAAYICGNQGYTILKQEDLPMNGSGSLWTVSTRQILVKCNALDSFTAMP